MTLAPTLVMRLGPIVFLSSWNRDRESVLFRSERTRGVGRNCAGRIVGSVKVNLYHPIHDRIGFEEAASGVGVGFTGQIVEDERQAFC